MTLRRRRAPEPTPGTIGVVLPQAARPGVLRVGAYVPGKVYQVPAAEAPRLVSAKGFQPATDEDAAALASAQSNAAAPSGAATPSYAGGQGGGASSDSKE